MTDTWETKKQISLPRWASTFLIAATMSSATAGAILYGPKAVAALNDWRAHLTTAPASKDSNWKARWNDKVVGGGPVGLRDALALVAPPGTNIQIADDVAKFSVSHPVHWEAGTRTQALDQLLPQVGGEGRALPGLLLVTPAPYKYVIRRGVSIVQQLDGWSRQAGWQLVWAAGEPSAQGGTMVAIDWPSAGNVFLGKDFDHAFASMIGAMNIIRKQRNPNAPVLSALADFNTGKIVVRVDKASPPLPSASTRNEMGAVRVIQ